MRKHLLLALLAGAAMSATAQEYTVLQDLTSSKITNADFSEGTVVDQNICTYDYDMADDGAGSGTEGAIALFGMQPVPGWTASSPTDNIKHPKDGDDKRTTGENAKAAGLFQYTDDTVEDGAKGSLGGVSYLAPITPAENPSGNLLGMVGVWGGEVAYTQPVSLSAGAYMIVIRYCNISGGATVPKTDMGFIANDGTEYLSSITTWTPGTSFETDTIAFMLKADTEGKISLGYKSGNMGSGDAPHIFVDYVKLYSIDPTPLQQKEIADAKVDLLAAIEEGQEVGADITAAMAVYNDNSATLQQVKDAIAAQKDKNAAAQTDLSLYFLKNPHFTEDNPIPEDNGICTYDYDMKDPNGNNQRVVNYFGMQPVANWEANDLSNNEEIDSNPHNGGACGVIKVGSNSWLGGGAFLPPTAKSDGSTEGNLLGFIAVWTKKLQYTQQVTLPKGQYTLEISFYNAGGTGNVAKNLMGFVEDDGTEHLGTTTSWAVGKWIKEKIKFTFDKATSGYFTMGYEAANAGSGSMPHFFIDGIAIYFVGELANPSLMGLQAALDIAKQASEKTFNNDVKAQLGNIIASAQSLVDNFSSDEEANNAAAASINEYMPTVNASIAAYEKLKNLEDVTLNDALEKYDAETYGDLNGILGDMQDAAHEAYDDGTWTTEQIEAAIDTVAPTIKKGVKTVWDAAIASGEALDNPLDISIFFADSLAYAYSTTAYSGGNVPDKAWKYGDAGNFKTQYGTAEVWNQSPFTVQTTLTNMPAGTYTITTKAFYRTADNTANYDNYTNGVETNQAYVFAGGSKTALTNVAAIASSEALDGWAQTSDGSGMYVPNSQKAAHDLFEDDTFTDRVQKSVQTVVANQGDLTFGITAPEALEGNSWVVWYTFSVAYNAVDDDILSEELTALVEEVSTFNDENSDAMTTAINEAVADVVTTAQDAIGQSKDEMAKAVADLKAALDFAKANIAAKEALDAANDALTEAQSEFEETASEEAKNEAAAALEAYAEAENFATNEEIDALTERMKNAAAALRVPDTTGASDEAPIDMTQVIQNNGFETGNLDGWTNSGTVSAQAQNNTSFESKQDSYYCEKWHVNGTININQTTPVLPAGTYAITAFAKSDADDAVLYANSDEVAISEEKSYTVVVKLDEPGTITFGVKWTDGGSKWTCVDEFTMQYNGTESELVPSGIETAEAGEAEPAAIFTVSGAQLNAPQKGINIVRYADGTVKKVLVK